MIFVEVSNTVPYLLSDCDCFIKNADLLHWKVSNLEKMEFTVMTSVQKLSIPVVLAGRDVLIQSQTGSGKLQ